MSLWGIDLGGTKIEGVVLSGPSPEQELCRLRIDTEREKGAEHIRLQIQKLINQMSEQVGHSPTRIGFGTPGAIEPSTGLLKNSNTICLNGTPLQKDLSSLLDAECILTNDANCFALAEATMGAAKDANVVFGVILGTGVGGGIIVNGQTINGTQGIAGEWGHNVVDHSDQAQQCFCGQMGCLDASISGTGLELFYKNKTGKSLRLKDIYAQKDSDEVAKETIDRLVELFSRAISVVINILDPDVIVLGGGVSNIDDLYTRAPEQMAKYVFNEGRLETKLLKHSLGDSAGVFGAALLVA